MRRLAVRFGGLPHSQGTLDRPPPEVAGDIARFWLRNINPFVPRTARRCRRRRGGLDDVARCATARRMGRDRSDRPGQWSSDAPHPVARRGHGRPAPCSRDCGGEDDVVDEIRADEPGTADDEQLAHESKRNRPRCALNSAALMRAWRRLSRRAPVCRYRVLVSPIMRVRIRSRVPW